VTRLGDIMTTKVLTAASDTSVAEVAQSMVKSRVGSALVMQSSVLVGIFTERDVLRAAASASDLTLSRVSQWMTKDPDTADPDLDSDEAVKLMLSRGFRHLPVLEGNQVAGIVSLRDVLSTRVRRPSG
jgi:CBS domain-containing protein